jgi:hypothetical protein
MAPFQPPKFVIFFSYLSPVISNFYLSWGNNRLLPVPGSLLQLLCVHVLPSIPNGAVQYNIFTERNWHTHLVLAPEMPSVID